MMMNMIERMKLVAGAGGLKHLPPTTTPLNLSVSWSWPRWWWWWWWWRRPCLHWWSTRQCWMRAQRKEEEEEEEESQEEEEHRVNEAASRGARRSSPTASRNHQVILAFKVWWWQSRGDCTPSNWPKKWQISIRRGLRHQSPVLCPACLQSHREGEQELRSHFR